MKKAWIILFAVTLVLALTACGGSQPAATQEQGDDADSGIMESGSSANFDFAVTSINRYDLANGDQAILIECSVTNKSEEEQVISSIMCVSATDTSDNELTSIFSEDPFAISAELAAQGVTLETLDDTVQPGGTLTGTVAFTAPKGTLVNTITFAQVLLDDEITLQLGGM